MIDFRFDEFAQNYLRFLNAGQIAENDTTLGKSKSLITVGRILDNANLTFSSNMSSHAIQERQSTSEKQVRDYLAHLEFTPRIQFIVGESEHPSIRNIVSHDDSRVTGDMLVFALDFYVGKCLQPITSNERHLQNSGPLYLQKSLGGLFYGPHNLNSLREGDLENIAEYLRIKSQKYEGFKPQIEVNLKV